MFFKYPKIYRLDSEEVEGILDHAYSVYEKLDGACVSMWLEDNVIKLASRNRELEADDDFRGFRTYVNGHDGIKKLFKAHPTMYLFGEWLVKHTLNYPIHRLNKFYVFDFYINDKKYVASKEIFEIYDIDVAPLLYKDLNIKDINELNKLLSKHNDIEGFVIKSTSFVNKFGHNLYGKLVKPEFAEVMESNRKDKRQKIEIDEGWIVGKYLTEARINKMVCRAIETYPKAFRYQVNTLEPLTVNNIKLISNLIYKDVLSEGILDIQKHLRTINFNKLLRLITDAMYNRGNKICLLKK